MSILRIVGVGSPFGDDQLGWRVAELLKKNIALQTYLGDQGDIQQIDRPGPTLLTVMQDTPILYVIDAIKTAHQSIGHIHRINAESINTESGFLSTHGFGLAQAIALAKALQQLPKQMIVYGIEIGEIDYQATLSQRVEVACQNLAEKIAQEILGKPQC